MMFSVATVALNVVTWFNCPPTVFLNQNEETLKKTVKMWQEKVKVSEENMAKVKAKAEEKIAE